MGLGTGNRGAMAGGSSAVVVSTHLDDAVLSCFGIVAGASAVVTVLAGIPFPGVLGEWDAHTGATDSAIRMHTRRREDESALLATKARAVHLDLLEAQYTDAMNIPPTSPDAICRALAVHLRNADSVYAPMGLGHPEHMIVRDAVLTLRPDATLYADLPFAFAVDPEVELVNDLTSARQRSERLLSLSNHARKLDACDCYRSQLDGLTALHGSFRTTAGLRTEVLWSLPRPRSTELRTQQPAQALPFPVRSLPV
ncbi:MAG TPA: hypothetical protein VGU02_11175 [Gaiellaceae bacterium]|nr:hypothetical protein [Gaiellaceae bacterium]